MLIVDALQVSEDHFKIGDERFDCSNVRGIRWRAVEKVKMIYFMPVGVYYTFEFTVEFANGAPLDFVSASLGKREFNDLDAKVQRLFAATRDRRLAVYREQMQREGYFQYDRTFFFSDGSVERKGRRLKLDLRTPARASVASTKLRRLPSGSIDVDTAWDRDCFHILLNDLHRQNTAA